jgi:hypothetical protein
MNPPSIARDIPSCDKHRLNVLMGALAQAGFVAMTFCMPASAATSITLVSKAHADEAPPLLYIAQQSIPPSYGALGATSAAPPTLQPNAGQSGGVATPTVRPTGGGPAQPKPKPPPTRDSSDSSR